ncbi:hypothetical protein K443DRAFT_683102 [Laccaria amethystina LaAM-08-1]|uniref:Uncharacterized protein n=1 Tax=Laccaria amethystina LaAM-08-1 TaxID=1095629 RepID=A0A0C9XGS4_9AGAR|nr:hypothetical protein K443DRAFT_683102 [Laccaria amethystina LaAM-08-1]
MINLTRTIDRATVYVYVPPRSSKVPPGTINDIAGPPSMRKHVRAVLQHCRGDEGAAKPC